MCSPAVQPAVLTLAGHPALYLRVRLDGPLPDALPARPITSDAGLHTFRLDHSAGLEPTRPLVAQRARPAKGRPQGGLFRFGRAALVISPLEVSSNCS